MDDDNKLQYPSRSNAGDISDFDNFILIIGLDNDINEIIVEDVSRS